MLDSNEVRKTRYDQFLTKAPEGCEKLTCRGCLLHGICPRQDNALEDIERSSRMQQKTVEK